MRVRIHADWSRTGAEWSLEAGEMLVVGLAPDVGPRVEGSHDGRSHYVLDTTGTAATDIRASTAVALTRCGEPLGGD